MNRKKLRAAGYTVTAKTDGNSVAFVLAAPGEIDREFEDHRMAWAFAERLRSRDEITAANAAKGLYPTNYAALA